MTIHDSIIELNQLYTDSKLKECYVKLRLKRCGRKQRAT